MSYLSDKGMQADDMLLILLFFICLACIVQGNAWETQEMIRNIAPVTSRR